MKTVLVLIFWLLSIVLLVFLTSGCMGLPTVEPTLTPAIVPTGTPAPTATATSLQPSGGTVQIIGDVWLRDANDIERGYLLVGAEVQAVCSDEWCHMGGLKFYRGCSSDNPAGLACRAR